MKTKLFIPIILLVLISLGGNMTAQAQAVTNTPTPTPSETPATVEPFEIETVYALVNVPDRGVVNIRSGPGREFARLGAFGAQQIDIELTGRTFGTFPRVWYQVRRTGGGTGWVGGYYLTEYVEPAMFCKDERAAQVVKDLGQAFIDKDGESLAQLVSPLHGMTVRLFRRGVAINYLWYAPVLFKSNYPVDWGLSRGSLKPNVAPFPDAFTPPMEEVFTSDYEMNCNDASMVSAAGVPAWPAEYSTINFYEVHGENTGSWLVGVDYFDKDPYIFAIIYFP